MRQVAEGPRARREADDADGTRRCRAHPAVRPRGLATLARAAPRAPPPGCGSSRSRRPPASPRPRTRSWSSRPSASAGSTAGRGRSTTSAPGSTSPRASVAAAGPPPTRLASRPWSRRGSWHLPGRPSIDRGQGRRLLDQARHQRGGRRPGGARLGVRRPPRQPAGVRRLPGRRPQAAHLLGRRRQAAGDQGPTRGRDRTPRGTGHPSQPVVTEGAMNAVSSWIDATVAALEPLADPAAAAPMAAYMKGVAPFLGIKSARAALRRSGRVGAPARPRRRRGGGREPCAVVAAGARVPVRGMRPDRQARPRTLPAASSSDPVEGLLTSQAVVGHGRLPRHRGRHAARRTAPRARRPDVDLAATPATAGSSARRSSTSAASARGRTSTACSRCASRFVAEREFFIAKAIGWALRDVTRGTRRPSSSSSTITRT